MRRGIPTPFGLSRSTFGGVVSVNRPVITIPADQTFNEDDAPLVFSTENLNEILVDDDVETSLTVSLSAPGAELSLSQTTGLSFTVGDGTSDATMSFSGDIVDLNLALLGLEFVPPTFGTYVLTVTVANTTAIWSRIVTIVVEEGSPLPDPLLDYSYPEFNYYLLLLLP